MKIDVIKTFFPNPELRAIVTGSTEDKEVSENTFTPNLLQLERGKREYYIALFLEALLAQNETKYQKDAKRIFEKFINAPKPDDFTFTALQETVLKVSTCFQESEKPIDVYGRFPKADMTIKKFKDMASNPKEALHFELEVARHADRDPDMVERRKKRDEKDSELFLYDNVQAGRGPKMVLHGTARTDRKDCVNELYRMLLKENVRVVVALNTFSDWDKVIPYYNQEELNRLDIGWKVICEKTEVLYRGKTATNIPKARVEEFKDIDKSDERLAEFMPRIEERTLVATQGGISRTITHLHYVNWPDRKEVPDLDALDVMLKRQDELIQKPDDAVSIHCQGGIGRTNAYALMTWTRAEIQASEKGGALELNIPEMMYTLKKQAPRLGGEPNGERFAQIYDIAFRHYTKTVV